MMKTHQTAFRRTTIASLLMAAALGLSGCADGPSDGTTTSGTTGGTTSGTTSGTTGGTTSGSTGGTTSGSTGGTTSGSTGGTTSGSTGGTTSGATGGTTGGTTSGSTGGTTGGAGIVCNPTSSTYRPIQLPNASVASATSGLCLLCSVQNAGNVIDADQTNFALMNTTVDLVGATSLTVTDSSTVYPAGRRVGFVVVDPNGTLLTLNVLQNATITTIRNGVDSQDSTRSATLSLDLVGTSIVGRVPFLLSFIPTAEFDAVRLNYGSTVSALASLAVLDACVSVGPGTATP